MEQFRTEAEASLFIQLTSNDLHRVHMALNFGLEQLDRGRPLTIFLNDKGVYAGSTVNADEFAAQQTTMASLSVRCAWSNMALTRATCSLV
jgi:hypothetical protein